MVNTELDLIRVLGARKRRSLRFSEFVERFLEDPKGCLHTSSTLIASAIHHFGFEIVVRAGEPAMSFNLFRDPFSQGMNAVFGQEHCIKRLVDVIATVGKESSPQRGIVLVGPPASGKTNIVDLIALAMEEYSKQSSVRLYSFFFRFESEDDEVVEFRPKFRHNPILLIPMSLTSDGPTTHPRQRLFEHVQRLHDERFVFPAYYQNGYLDKRSLDILEKLLENPRVEGQTLYDVLEKYVRVEEFDLSNAQGRGIANIDDMRQLRVMVQPENLGEHHRAVVNEHVPGAYLYEYRGALVSANRGVLHIHDAFGGEEQLGPSEEDYKPLLMLLGSGKASVEATQTPIDTTVIATTNLEEMERLERQLTSSKLLDRIEEIPVNYLLDAYSEMDILRRDMSNMRERYDVDPNLFRIATYFSVLTRLLPPMKVPPLASWSEEKKKFYLSITPEQKLFIYTAQPSDPMNTIRKLPEWHPFRNELMRQGFDINDEAALRKLIVRQHDRVTLDQCGVFSPEQLKMIDDEFMRTLWREHFPYEGKHGVSVRQLQNLMRDTIAASNGVRIHVGGFFSRLKRTISESLAQQRWHRIDSTFTKDRPKLPKRIVGRVQLDQGEGDYGDFRGLAKVARALYSEVIRSEIVVATVNRDPEEIALDLRRYLQNVLLLRARENRAFAHVMVPRFTYYDPVTGEKVEEPDLNYMQSIEKILSPGRPAADYRRETAERYLNFADRGDLTLHEGQSILAAREDNLLVCFGQEYSRLLSHRRTIDEIDPSHLSDALFQKRMSPDEYSSQDAEVQHYIEEILLNMQRRFRYSKDSALDTILYALRKDIVDFEEIIS